MGKRKKETNKTIKNCWKIFDMSKKESYIERTLNIYGSHEDIFLNAIVARLVTQFYKPEEYIVKQYEESNTLYFII